MGDHRSRFVVYLLVAAVGMLITSSVGRADHPVDRWQVIENFEKSRKGALDLRKQLEAFQPSAPVEVASCFRLIDEFLVKVARLEVGFLHAQSGVPNQVLETETVVCMKLADQIKERGLRVIRTVGKSTPNRKNGSDQEIDRWVDQQVEKNWRPMPNGNSKEDAAILSKAILKARTYEELERVLVEQSQAGR